MKLTKNTWLLCLILAGCASKTETPNTDIGVAEAFINSINHRKFTEAKQLMVNDKENEDMFVIFKQHFEQKPATELMEYEKASIVVHQLAPANDTVSLLRYSLSIKKADTNELKLVKTDGKWQVDLKHTLTGSKK
jgi:hypothetical protein